MNSVLLCSNLIYNYLSYRRQSFKAVHTYFESVQSLSQYLMQEFLLKIDLVIWITQRNKSRMILSASLENFFSQIRLKQPFQLIYSDYISSNFEFLIRLRNYFSKSKFSPAGNSELIKRRKAFQNWLCTVKIIVFLMSNIGIDKRFLRLRFLPHWWKVLESLCDFCLLLEHRDL